MPLHLKRRDGSVTPFRNSEYIPFYYFIPKSILSRCGAELNSIPRNPQKLLHDSAACDFVEKFLPDKIRDEDYYILTLVAIAKELQREKLTEAKVIIAAGLPLTWTSGQKKDFAAYLSKNKEVRFTYQKVDYHITVEGVRIYPQG